MSVIIGQPNCFFTSAKIGKVFSNPAPRSPPMLDLLALSKEDL
jgi:hypothetical protein